MKHSFSHLLNVTFTVPERERSAPELVPVLPPRVKTIPVRGQWKFYNMFLKKK